MKNAKFGVAMFVMQVSKKNFAWYPVRVSNVWVFGKYYRSYYLSVDGNKWFEYHRGLINV